MKTMRLFSMVLGGLMVIVAITLTVSGCGGKKEIVPVAVGEMETYHDPVVGYSISYPKGWIPDVEAGRRARFWSLAEVGKRSSLDARARIELFAPVPAGVAQREPAVDRHGRVAVGDAVCPRHAARAGGAAWSACASQERRLAGSADPLPDSMTFSGTGSQRQMSSIRS